MVNPVSLVNGENQCVERIWSDDYKMVLLDETREDLPDRNDLPDSSDGDSTLLRTTIASDSLESSSSYSMTCADDILLVEEDAFVDTIAAEIRIEGIDGTISNGSVLDGRQAETDSQAKCGSDGAVDEKSSLCSSNSEPSTEERESGLLIVNGKASVHSRPVLQANKRITRSSRKSTQTMPLSTRDRTINQGLEYQCPAEALEIFEGVDGKSVDTKSRDRDYCVWKSPSSMSHAELNDYLAKAFNEYRLNTEQALFVLLKSHFDVNEAFKNSSMRKVVEDWWSEDDVEKFITTLREHGKDFRYFLHFFSDRSMHDVINFYYMNKKRPHFRARIAIESRNTWGMRMYPREEGSVIETCQNCDSKPSDLYELVECNAKLLCTTCAYHYRAYGFHRLIKGKFLKGPNALGSVEEIATYMESFAEDSRIIRSKFGLQTARTVIDQKLDDLVRDIESIRQSCTFLADNIRRLANDSNIDDLKRELKSFTQQSRPRITSTWDDQEKRDALFVLRRYGVDFVTASDLLRTKTPTMVEAFYNEHKAKIDEMIDDYNRLVEQQRAQQSRDSGTISAKM